MIMLIGAIIILAILTKRDASFIGLRIEMMLAMIGVDYKPSSSVSWAVSVAMLVVVYFVLFTG